MRYEWNRDVLRGSGIVVFLAAEFATLAARVRGADRPRVKAGVSFEDDLARIWSTSAHLYEAADVVHRTDEGRTVEEDVAALQARLTK